LKRDYIINTYTKGKKTFYLSFISNAVATSVLTILFIDVIIIIDQGYSNIKFLLLISLGYMLFFNLIALLIAPYKWNEIVKKYNNL
jgi:hypothetical protein